MGLLFFSGLSVVIARIIYELSCPKLVKAYINPTSLDARHLQNQEWLQVELEHCLLQYVHSLPTTEEYLERKQLVRMRDSSGDTVSSMWTPCLGFPGLRIGFDAYGVWLIKNLLWRIAKERQSKRGIKGGFSECEEPGATFTSGYHDLFCITLKVADKYTAEEKEIDQGSLLVSVHGSSDDFLDYDPKHTLIHNYFMGIEQIAGLGANDIVKEFIAENENYCKPFARIATTFSLLLSLTFLLVFLIIQTTYVFKAIYLYFLK